MKFSFLKTEVFLDFWFFAFIGIFLLMGLDMVMIMSAALIHELGHIVATTLLGGRIERLTTFGLAINMQASFDRIGTFRRDFLAVLAGPAFGLIAMFIALAFGKFQFAMINLVLTAFNLLPIEGLDGKSLVDIMKNSK